MSNLFTDWSKKRRDSKYKSNWDKKINRLIENVNGDFTSEMEDEVKEVWKQYADVNPNWAKWYYLSNGHFSPYYIPSDIYFARVCRVLNSRNRFSYPLLQDKNYLDMIFADIDRTETIVHSVNSQLLNRDYKPINIDEAIDICRSTGMELVVKPSIDSSGARNVEFINATDCSAGSLKGVLEKHGTDYVVQKALKQHSKMKELNPDSINTIRVLSLLWGDKVIIIGSLVRIGVKGVRVDNLVATNGVSCCIDASSGNFISNAYDRNGKAYKILPNGIKLDGYPIPGYFNVIEAAKELHYRLCHFRLIGWDFAVGEDEKPILIETNLAFPELDFHQIGTGPLFGDGDLFKEIMDYVFKQENYDWYKTRLY